MKAIERVIYNDNWVTLVIILAIVLLAMMKLLKPTKLYGYTIAFVTPGFFHKRMEEGVSFFTPFKLLLFSFSIIVISLFLFFTLVSEIYSHSFLAFLGLFLFVSVYFSVRFFLDYALANILGLSKTVNYFLYTKSGYLYVLSIWLFPIIILYQYTFTNKLFLIYSFCILLVFRVFLILTNNKKLVISKLFYFILYFCTLEIAPLLILYKTTTT
ncbi:protein of unknown function [Tenacibaculum mesophilum]|uniref:DUF4271 domain-containing protein n=1 Tax=Tenacibaculum mesophilum TaxID=104268 RepID=A0ABM7CHA4_9FLAO|nr:MULTISPECIES: DUF4271 domain-containing protein [Tenacibaculum]GFD78532.1 DUF4271 domain-containing protein [Tenacibaculum sp. KUL118]GFE00793.1 DUF4271 domain-containing protein [Alteromonas sp. KUL156]AZJ33206.1 DUF4271 domain-containing protein [Tenacibaculum mesophilum]MCO7184412.1 DUF4271 domain-containing protein [Tenacibaculum sp. XPcli2-G]QFS28455.1 DUF4271 domain-containing protein [Tenacibaculum mesophilum]